MFQPIKKYIDNGLWQLLEMLFRVVSLMVVSTYMARTMGPTDFGSLTFVISIVSIFAIIVHFGLDGVLIKEFLNKRNLHDELIVSGFSIGFFLSLLCYSVLSFYCVIFEADKRIAIGLGILGISLFFRPYAVLDYYFQSRLRSKLPMLAKMFSTAVVAILKIYLAWIEASFYSIVLAYLLDIVIFALLMTFIFKANRGPQISLPNVKAQKPLIRSLIIECWPLCAAALISVVYTKLDQIMIRYILGANELGLYAVSTMFYEAWVMLTYVVGFAIMPYLSDYKKSTNTSGYITILMKIFSLFFYTGVIYAVVTSSLSSLIISVFFGSEYDGSKISVVILLISAPFLALRTITVRYLTLEKKGQVVLNRTIQSLVLNFVLNAILIPHYGIEGAAIATVVSIIYGSFISCFTMRDARGLGKMLTRSIILKY